MSVWVAPLLDTPTAPLNISQEVLRSVLYGKWVYLKDLLFKAGLLEKVDYSSDEEPEASYMGSMKRVGQTALVPVLNNDSAKIKQLCLENDSFFVVVNVSLTEQVTIAPSSIYLPGVQPGVFSTCWIKEGTQMGPYTGRIVKVEELSSDIDNSLMWEVLNEDGSVSHFLDAKDENPRNWMGFVNCARNEPEQNLDVFQYGGNIYYRAVKDIPPDRELLVWYGGTYIQFLGIPGIAPVNDFVRRKRRGPEDESSEPAAILPEMDEAEHESALSLSGEEPLADDEDSSDGEEDEDEDGLSPATLERRYDKTDPVQSWCSCNHCNDEHLDSALEYRCCKEVNPVLSLLMFDGSGEHISCITHHPDFEPMTNKTVLKNVAPLMRDKQGKGYRRQPGRSENELLRATAYRWLIRWLCGFLGWENTRPLPACVYHSIRTRIPTQNVTGYATAQERNNGKA